MILKLKTPGINKKTFLNAAFNAGRSLINPLFIAVVSFLFLRRGLGQELTEINEVTALFNLVLVFSGWGLRDYLIKESARHYPDFSKNWHLAFYSKFILLLPLVIISLLCFPNKYLSFIILILFFRTFGSLYESLIIFHKKSTIFFAVDSFVALLVIILIWRKLINDYRFFFYFLIVSELIKAIINGIMFKKPLLVSFNFRELFMFLRQTKFYFFIVLISFFQSRVDLYLLGFLFNPEKLNEYQLLLSLISLAQIVIVSLVVSYSKLFYRSINFSMLTYRKIILRTGFIIATGSTLLVYLILNFMYGFDFGLVNIPVVFINIISFTWVLYEMNYYTKLEWFNRMLVFVFISGLANFLFGLAFIPVFGVTGALAGNSCAMLLLATVMTTRRVILLKEARTL